MDKWDSYNIDPVNTTIGKLKRVTHFSSGLQKDQVYIHLHFEIEQQHVLREWLFLFFHFYSNNLTIVVVKQFSDTTAVCLKLSFPSKKGHSPKVLFLLKIRLLFCL
jgi:hypothetical protein